MSIRAELLPPFGICCLWTAAFSILIIILPMAALKLKKKKEGLALILLDEKSLPGWYTCGDFIWLFFKHSEREAKNLFHLRAIKWIPESLAPARRRGLFFFPWFYYPFPLPCASRRNAHFSLTKPHFQRQNHTGTTMIKCKPVLP